MGGPFWGNCSNCISQEIAIWVVMCQKCYYVLFDIFFYIYEIHDTCQNARSSLRTSGVLICRFLSKFEDNQTKDGDSSLWCDIRAPPKSQS